MAVVPECLTGPWSNTGYLLLAHMHEHADQYAPISMSWAAQTLSITEAQLRTILHRDNKDSKRWLPDMLERLREQGYPELILFEQCGDLHYTYAKRLDFTFEVVYARTPMRFSRSSGR